MSEKLFIKSFKIAVFAILLALSSCNIQERRYTKGYYIEFLRSKSNSKAIQVKKEDHKRNNIVVKEKKFEDSLSATIETTAIDFKNDNLIASNKKAILMIKNTNYKPIEQNMKTIENKQSINKIQHKKLKENEILKKASNNDGSKRRLAIIIGCSILLLGTIAFLITPILSQLFVLGNPVLTGLNVSSNFSKFTKHTIGCISIMLLDILIGLGMNKYYKKEKPKLATLTSVLRLIYSAILGIAIFQLLRVSSTSSASIIYNSITGFNKFWSFGLILFGFHLIALGLLFNNEGGKKWVNIAIKSLLIIAGIGYIFINLGALFVPNPVAFVAMVQPIFLLPMILGEVLYAIWKIAKGGKQLKD